MPIYEYRCNACGHITSVLVRSSATASAPTCEACASGDVARHVSLPALIRSTGGAESGTLRAVDPRRAIQEMGDMYNQKGMDPGKGFNEIVSRVAAGDSPHELKEAIKEVRQKESPSGQAPSKG
jgi:putative FmdB family regulatory protein